MAVNIGTELVNNGNSGWSNLDVMNSLEKVFSDMGWNSGTQKNGVPITLIYPGGYTTGGTATGTVYDQLINTNTDATPTVQGSSNWGRCGGTTPAFVNSRWRYFYVNNNGTTSYEVSEWIVPSSNVNNNVITANHYMGDNLITGTKLTYNGGVGGNGGATEVITGLSSGNVYYMRRITEDSFSLHPTSSDAQNDTNIVTCSYTNVSSNPVRFQTDAETNPTITVGRGDRIYFYTYDMTQGNFRICDFSTGSSYAADRTYHTTDNLTNATQGAKVFGTGVYSDPFYWLTGYVNQTENEVLDPTQISGIGFTGIAAYGYANDSNTGGNLKGNIVINPKISNVSSYLTTYWKYTVTGADGDAANTGTGRTDLKLRIYRDDYSTYRGQITGILICNEATGWSDNDVFTIPGTAIGGTSPTNDITFGENNYVSGDNNTPNMLTTNLGAGTNMFQKSNDGRYGVLRLENDSSKKFGVTYWGFSLPTNLRAPTSTDVGAGSYITFQSGSGWSYLNRLGKHFEYTAGYEGAFGAFNGDMGLDYQGNYNTLTSAAGSGSGNYKNYHSITTSSGGDNYPLKIRYYKAQAPQDTNFAVIQFVQTENSVEKAWVTFTLHKGTSFGANVWDLDEVWNGTYTEYETYEKITGVRGRSITTWYTMPGYQYNNNEGPTHEPPVTSSLVREASYGYLRTTSGNTRAETEYPSNINSINNYDQSEVYMYYRNSTYDKVTNNSIYKWHIQSDQVSSVGVNYYKPIKGIPISNQLSPCPYYMPDDFVLIQAEVNPGATEFRVGDTVNIGSSENYTVIIADNVQNISGLDGNTSSNNFANGILFCARN